LKYFPILAKFDLLLRLYNLGLNGKNDWHAPNIEMSPEVVIIFGVLPRNKCY